MESYSKTAKILHWLCSLTIITMITLGFLGTHLHKPIVKNLFFIHKSLGLSLLILMIIRLIYRIKHTPPAPLPAPKAQQVAAWLTHITLYCLIIGTILIGWSMSAFSGHPIEWWGWFNVSLPFTLNKPLAHLLANIHSIIAWVLVVLISLHILAAWYHHLICKDDTLKRMLP